MAARNGGCNRGSSIGVMFAGSQENRASIEVVRPTRLILLARVVVFKICLIDKLSSRLIATSSHFPIVLRKAQNIEIRCFRVSRALFILSASFAAKHT